MEMLRNYKLSKNVNFTIFLKKFTFLFLVLSYHTYNDVSPSCKSLENMYKQHKTWNTKVTRLLAKYEQLRELESTRLREKLSDRRPYMENRNVSDNIKTYSHVKRNVSNNIEVYMKNYKKRYMRKKGLSKLDCYCENKVFSKFNNICDIGKKMKYDEKRAKNIFLKYGIVLIFLSLIPALGLIFPILFGIKRHGKGIFKYCLVQNHKSDPSNCTRTYKWYGYKEIIESIGSFSYIFFSIFGVIVSLVLIYILIKVIKYERLKAGRGKLCVKEYCRFAKDVFI